LLVLNFFEKAESIVGITYEMSRKALRMLCWKRPCRIRGSVLAYVIRGTEVNKNKLASDIQCLEKKKFKDFPSKTHFSNTSLR